MTTSQTYSASSSAFFFATIPCQGFVSLHAALAHSMSTPTWNGPLHLLLLQLEPTELNCIKVPQSQWFYKTVKHTSSSAFALAACGSSFAKLDQKGQVKQYMLPCCFSFLILFQWISPLLSQAGKPAFLDLHIGWLVESHGFSIGFHAPLTQLSLQCLWANLPAFDVASGASASPSVEWEVNDPPNLSPKTSQKRVRNILVTRLYVSHISHNMESANLIQFDPIWSNLYIPTPLQLAKTTAHLHLVPLVLEPQSNSVRNSC